MPVDFITPEQQKKYGRFDGDPSPEQLDKFFYLDDAALAFVRDNLGCAIQLGTVRFLGTFLTDPADVPACVVQHVANQIDFRDPFGFLQTYRTSQMPRAHAREIRARYGYVDCDDREWFRLKRWLYTRVWGSPAGPMVLFDLATARLAERKVLLPGASKLARVIAQVRERVADSFWVKVARVLTLEQRDKLAALMDVPDGGQQTVFEQLRRSPTSLSATGLVSALKRLRTIRELDVGRLDISHIHPGRLSIISRYSMDAKAQAIERLPLDRRLATLLAFAQTIEVRACDDAIDILVVLLKEIQTQAANALKESRQKTLFDYDMAALRLAKASRIFIDPEHRDLETARNALFSEVPRDKVLAAVDTVEGIASAASKEHVYTYMLDHYRSARLFLPTLLETIAFEGSAIAKPVIEGWNVLRELERQEGELTEEQLPSGVVSDKWKQYVVPRPGVVSRQAYTMCVLDHLWHGLQRREVFAPCCEKWCNPAGYLVPAASWPSERPKICAALNLPATPQPFIDLLREELDFSYNWTADRAGENPDLRIEDRDGEERLVLSPLEAVDDPPSLKALRAKLKGLIPRLDLPDLILEVATWTGFWEGFTHISDGPTRVENLATSICAVLLASSCNLGIEAVTQYGSDALGPARLSHVSQNYIRAETLRAANTRLVNYQSTLPLANTWGGRGGVAVVDGIRFVVAVRSINAGPNPKYFGVKNGLTYLYYVSGR